jgi:hypothetical protein
MTSSILDPCFVDPRLDARATSFENPTGARGAGGRAHGGRKGAPSRFVEPGERVTLADLEGPGTIRHIWMTFPPARPEALRSLLLEVYYDGAAEPSVAVPCLDFFGLPHGRPVAYHSALVSVHEGRGFNATIPLPFRRHVRVDFVNAGDRRTLLYYQLDYTLEPELAPQAGLLHVRFARENPTTLRRDFVIAEGLRGPGRFLGCNVGVRVIDPGRWYGEGEVKVYRDGDGDWPTICGTGLEDYVGSAWGMGAHAAPYGGAPLVRGGGAAAGGANPEFVGFYRWHLPDPIMFARELRVTIQQIGAMFFAAGDQAAVARYSERNPPAGAGLQRLGGGADAAVWGIFERVDDYCATAYLYCREPQPVPRVDVAAALADISARDHEAETPRAPATGG